MEEEDWLRDWKADEAARDARLNHGWNTKLAQVGEERITPLWIVGAAFAIFIVVMLVYAMAA